MDERYTSSAAVYDLIYADIVDYPAAASTVTELVRARHPQAKALLEVGCGTGAVLAELTGSFDVAGLDISEEMLVLARAKLPNVALHQADMVDFDLGRQFDAVICMFSSIGYATDLESLAAAYGRFAAHLVPGGVVIVEAWFRPDQFQPGWVGASTAGGPEFRVQRMNTSWLEDDGRVSVMDMHHLVGEPGGVTHFVERHRMGLFTVDEHLDSLRAAGITAEHREDLFMGRGTYIGIRS
jgi:SAM-dependent methyltransferase